MKQISAYSLSASFRAGYVDSGVTIFRGIPFAAPPTDFDRFKAPKPPKPWIKPREAFLQANVCPQFRILV